MPRYRFNLPFCRRNIQKSKLRERDRRNMNQQSTASKDLLFETREGIGRVTFNRPQVRNALTFEMYELLAQVCHQAIEDLILMCHMSQDFREGLDAFLNKRQPHWLGE
jgi:enoyl-CoA hydratase/carnithine racemase